MSFTTTDNASSNRLQNPLGRNQGVQVYNTYTAIFD
jgi:hypothetical protein